MGENVVKLVPPTSPVESDVVLEAAKARLTEVVVIGYDNDGDLYVASSNGRPGDALWLLETAKLFLLNGGE